MSILFKRYFKLNHPPLHPYIYITLFGILLRCILLFVFDAPVIHGDSYGYLDLADRLKEFSLKDYEGFRTPGYPLLLSLFSKNAVIVIQVLMSLISSFFVYEQIKPHSRVFAILTSLFTITLLNCMSLDFAILSEVSTQFVLISSLWYVYANKLLLQPNSTKKYLILSIILATLFLTRPMYILVTPILFVFLAFQATRYNYKSYILKLLLVLALPAMAYNGWSYLNYKNHGWFTVTTFYGINLAQNCFGFIDKLPEEHKVIRDIYMAEILPQTYENKDVTKIEYFKQFYFDETNDAMTIWRAYPNLLLHTELEASKLSMKLTSIFKHHIRNYPKEYAHQVFRSWTHFWNHYEYFKVDNTSVSLLPSPWQQLWRLQRVLLVLLNLLFFPLSIFSLWYSLRQRHIFSFNNLMIAIVYASSISQALVTYGENARFAFPTFFLLIIVNINTIIYLCSKRRTS